MKRFHVHVSVDDLTASIRFYSVLFAAEPVVVKDDYAKWMLDDPWINFAVSNRGRTLGIDHIGIQVDSDSELRALRGQLEAADSALVEQSETTCCYAKGDKYWVTDPTGIAWETYHTLSEAPMFGEDLIRPTDGACCAPAASGDQGSSDPSSSNESCCG